MAMESDSVSVGYQQDLIRTRRLLREALSGAQTTHDDHIHPLFRGNASSDALQAHRLVIDLVGEIAPRQGEIPELWENEVIAAYEHPVHVGGGNSGTPVLTQSLQSEGEIRYRTATVEGLSNLLVWRNVQLPQKQSAPGDTSANGGISSVRAFMPIDVLSGARLAIDNALAALGWLPEGEPGDYAETEPSI